MDAGVLPTNPPSISISAPVGLEEVSNTDDDDSGVAVAGAFESAGIVAGVAKGVARVFGRREGLRCISFRLSDAAGIEILHFDPRQFARIY